MLKATGKQQTLKAAVLSAVMVMSAIGMNVADAALNEAGKGADNNVAFGAGSNAGGKNSTVIGPNANTPAHLQVAQERRHNLV